MNCRTILLICIIVNGLYMMYLVATFDEPLTWLEILPALILFPLMLYVGLRQLKKNREARGKEKGRQLPPEIN